MVENNLIGKKALLIIKRMDGQEEMTFLVEILKTRERFGRVETQVKSVRGKNWVRLDRLEILD